MVKHQIRATECDKISLLYSFNLKWNENCAVCSDTLELIYWPQGKIYFLEVATIVQCTTMARIKRVHLQKLCLFQQ